jgi:hypothetical protein
VRKFLLYIFLIISVSTNANELCDIVDGAVIIAQDGKNTYLGKLSNSFDDDSIFNEFGTYGSEFNNKSIWNEFSTFGSEFNSFSPFNEFSTKPPMIIKNKKIIGYLSVNGNIQAAVSPNILKAMCGG